ncbi:MAG: cytidine deaminase [Rikenellaceae bacterium]
MIIEYKAYESLELLNEEERGLVESARRAAADSHSPYSRFSVGAAIKLANGEMVGGFNIESEVFPAGICAERAALTRAAVEYPNVAVEAIAVTSISTESECYPCGLCRQTLLDVERRQGSKIKIIMAGEHSATVVESAQTLLPFTFNL